MKMLAAVVALALAVPAHADELEPAVELDETTELDPGTKLDGIVLLEEGMPAPRRGLLVPETKAIDLARRIAGCQAERDALAASPPTAWGVVVAVAAAALAVGVGTGVGIGVALKK